MNEHQFKHSNGNLTVPHICQYCQYNHRYGSHRLSEVFTKLNFCLTVTFWDMVWWRGSISAVCWASETHTQTQHVVIYTRLQVSRLQLGFLLSLLTVKHSYYSALKPHHYYLESTKKICPVWWCPCRLRHCDTEKSWCHLCTFGVNYRKCLNINLYSFSELHSLLWPLVYENYYK